MTIKYSMVTGDGVRLQGLTAIATYFDIPQSTLSGRMKSGKYKTIEQAIKGVKRKCRPLNDKELYEREKRRGRVKKAKAEELPPLWRLALGLEEK